MLVLLTDGLSAKSSESLITQGLWGSPPGEISFRVKLCLRILNLFFSPQISIGLQNPPAVSISLASIPAVQLSLDNGPLTTINIQNIPQVSISLDENPEVTLQLSTC